MTQNFKNCVRIEGAAYSLKWFKSVSRYTTRINYITFRVDIAIVRKGI